MHKYQRIFEEVYKLVGSRVSALEFLYILSGIKNASRLIVHSSNITLFTELCQRNDLIVVFSDSCFAIPSATSYQNSIGKLTKECDYYYKEAYISVTESEVVNLKEATSGNDHRKVGVLLDYPICCIDFFMSWFALGQLKGMDFTSFISCGDKVYPYELNIFSKEFDACFLSHFPCSIDCSDSLKQAQVRKHFVQSNFPEIDSSFRKEMKSCVAYNSRSGVICSKSFDRDENDELIIIPRGNFYVNGEIWSQYETKTKIKEIAQSIWPDIEVSQIKTVAFI
ncbi:hypothetical protein BCT04_03315 [Vibrio breoganii]|uniref:hypothetical protein n=1 Tax=Vibrio breoganii TaxID=553239 RepID=UPI000C831919|nr:hypothetical protein [Vibrio breoganii]PMG94305.1 hypothetical protein BCU80_00515 [Vibrio breoganii]PMK27390.1 hypothetical protein BCU03_02030 [Vibrio breoganii]PMK52172.1 hypothetical protein BCT98_15510 [Vibrio breoganii]PMK72833.1 hypothetical protein BCT94_12775 [Vibrio breoganii]PMO71742.1 hypothetical protein BCT04_03315 [Vibrio breoganii]